MATVVPREDRAGTPREVATCGEAPAGRPGGRRGRGPSLAPSAPAALATLAVHGLVAWLYVWVATGGTYRFQARNVNYYDLLADAFLAGQLHLNVAPTPELLALSDPYDPSQNAGHRLHDALLYEGRYYLYWGPVPGVIHAAWKGLTGSPLTDSVMVALFGVGSCFWFWLLARELRDRAFPGVSDGGVLLVYLCYALGGVSVFLQARPVIYHEAILGGTFFMLGGWYLWLRALAGGRSSKWQLLLAGLLFACGVGSRITMIGYPLGAGLVLVWQWLRAGRCRSAAGPFLAFGLSPTAMVALLLLYNYARFGSFSDFGFKYMLAAIPMTELAVHLGPLNVRNFGLNLAAYLAFVPTFVPYFPFQLTGPAELAAWQAAPWLLDAPFISTLLAAPLTLLAPLSVGLLTRRHGRADPAVRAFVIAAGLGVLYALGVVLVQIAAVARYMQDFLPIACLLGGLGLWWLRPPGGTRRSRRLAHRALGATVLTTSLVMGLSLAMFELSVGFPETYTRLAYRFDSAIGGVARSVAPTSWPASYLHGEIRERPLGLFYPDQTTLLLPARTAPIRSIEVESLFEGGARLAIEIDGRIVGEGSVYPGRQVLALREAAPAPIGQAAVRLHVLDQGPRPAGSLWPLRVGSLSSIPLAIPAAAYQQDGGCAPTEEDRQVQRLRRMTLRAREVAEQRQATAERLGAEADRVRLVDAQSAEAHRALLATAQADLAAGEARAGLDEQVRLLRERETTLVSARTKAAGCTSTLSDIAPG